MILKIKVNNKVYGLHLYENNENGEIDIVESFDPDTPFREINSEDIINQGDMDDIFGTNEQMIIIKTSEGENMDAKEIGEIIAKELMYENKDDKRVSDDSIEKDCYLAVADLKADIREEVEKILEKNNYTIS